MLRSSCIRINGRSAVNDRSAPQHVVVSRVLKISRLVHRGRSRVR
jgi:hypothetical protein